MEVESFENNIDKDANYVPPPIDEECLLEQNFPNCVNGQYSPPEEVGGGEPGGENGNLPDPD